MLNGIAPIFLFNFYKVNTAVIKADLAAELSKVGIPIPESSTMALLPLPPIPLYLDEGLTGIYVESENKNIDIETAPETLVSGKDPIVNQKGINSIVTINLIASNNSIGMTLIAAMADLIFTKVTSREYSITYLHGAVTVFNGLLHSFSINQSADNTLYNVSIQLARSTLKTTPTPGIVNVPNVTGNLPLG